MKIIKRLGDACLLQLSFEDWFDIGIEHGWADETMLIAPSDEPIKPDLGEGKNEVLSEEMLRLR